MYNAEFWFNVTDPKSGRFIIPEEWEGDTSSYIEKLKSKATNKQTKKFLDGLKGHLKKHGFLSDEQKSALASVSVGTKGDSKDTSKEKPKKEIKKSKEDVKGKSKEKPEKEIKKKSSKETGKEIKKQIGTMLGKLGGLGKEMASKVDSKAVDAIDKGVAGGANVKDATASVLDKIKDDIQKKKEEKEIAKKKKAEAKKVKKAKKESFEYRFRDYLINS